MKFYFYAKICKNLFIETKTELFVDFDQILILLNVLVEVFGALCYHSNALCAVDSKVFIRFSSCFDKVPQPILTPTRVRGLGKI